MIKYGLKAVTKDIDVVLKTEKELETLIQSLESIGYKTILDLIQDTQNRFTTKIMENKDGFRWDVFYEYVCKKLKLTESIISRSKTLMQTGNLTVQLVSKEDIFLLKTLTEREEDEEDLLILARSTLNWKTILQECIKQSRTDLKCEIDLYDILEKLKNVYGLESPILNEISVIAEKSMDDWFEEQILKQISKKPLTLQELQSYFKCEKELLLPSINKFKDYLRCYPK
ncbi:MAG: nucleotidyltransferase [Methanosarcinales archaeon]